VKPTLHEHASGPVHLPLTQVLLQIALHWYLFLGSLPKPELHEHVSGAVHILFAQDLLQMGLH
jgi:hypothetical protein